MPYRCEATTLEGFVQQLACGYLQHGYWFYVTGQIPAGKDPAGVDQKLLERYSVAASRWERSRRKRAGLGNAHYIRLDRFFVLLATHGHDVFFELEGDHVRDARRIPVKVGGYALSYRHGHPHVRIERGTYLRLKAHFLELAKHRSVEKLAGEFYTVPFEPWAPVRSQLRCILRAVNRERQRQGYTRVPIHCLPWRRRIVKPFDCVASPAPSATEAA